MSSSGAQVSVTPPSEEDLEAITSVARDYIEGWLDGDAMRMKRCLHPELVKRTVRRDAASSEWMLGRTVTADMMVEWTRSGEGRTTVAEERVFEIVIEDVFRHIASVRVLSSPYMDYLHVAKVGDRWFIVHALWETRESQTQL
jgi:hypothetical protein